MVPLCLLYIGSSTLPALWPFKSAGRGKVLFSNKNNILSDTKFWRTMTLSGLNYSNLLSSQSYSKTWISHSFSHTRIQLKIPFSFRWCTQAFATSFQDQPTASPAFLACPKMGTLKRPFSIDFSFLADSSETELSERKRVLTLWTQVRYSIRMRR